MLERPYNANPLGHTLLLPRAQLISYACCVSAPALQQPRQASPERVGEYSQTELFYRGLRKMVNERLLAHFGGGILPLLVDEP